MFVLVKGEMRQMIFFSNHGQKSGFYCLQFSLSTISLQYLCIALMLIAEAVSCCCGVVVTGSKHNMPAEGPVVRTTAHSHPVQNSRQKLP
jgi:hypothetical protein